MAKQNEHRIATLVKSGSIPPRIESIAYEYISKPSVYKSYVSSVHTHSSEESGSYRSPTKRLLDVSIEMPDTDTPKKGEILTTTIMETERSTFEEVDPEYPHEVNTSPMFTRGAPTQVDSTQRLAKFAAE